MSASDLQVEVTDTAAALDVSVNGATGGVTGLTMVVAIRNGITSNSWLDFNDNTFKTSGWTTRQAAMTEISAGNAPGQYQYLLNVNALSLSAGAQLIAEYDGSGSEDVNGHDRIILRDALYQVAAPGDAMDLIADAVDAAAVATGAIDADAIAANAITSAKIAASAIGASQIAANAIGASKIATAAITNAKFAAGAIDANAIAANAITAAKIAASAIGASQIATGAITNAKFAAGAIDAAAIAGNAITAAKIATDAIGALQLATDAVNEIRDSILSDATAFQGADIAAILADTAAGGAGPWTTGAGSTPQAIRDAMKLAPTAGAPAAGSIDQELDDVLADTAAIDAAVAANLDAAVSTRSAPGDAMDLIANAVDAAAIATGAIDADAIAANAITAAKVATDAIGALQLATDAVNEIRDAILSDSTAFDGADIAAILIDTAAGGAGPWTTGAGSTPQAIRDAMKLAPTAGAPAAGSIDQELDDVLADTAAIDAAVAANLDAAVSTRAAPGDAMDLIAGAITAATIATDAIGAAQLATDAVNEIRDAILSDSTPFAGADIAAILADTAAGGPGPWTTGGGGPGGDGAILETATITSQISTTQFVTALAAPSGYYAGLQIKFIDDSTGAEVVRRVINTIGTFLTIDSALPFTADPGVDTVAVLGRLGTSAIDQGALVTAIWSKLQSSEAWPAGSFGEYLDAQVSLLGGQAVIDAINAAVALILAAFAGDVVDPTCGVGVLPNVYVGHKGDQLLMQVYRNGSPIDASSLTGATGLEVKFKNLDGAENFTITAGVTVGAAGNIQYTTTTGDGVFEAAGTWEYQASGTLLSGEPFVSQAYQSAVLGPVTAPP